MGKGMFKRIRSRTSALAAGSAGLISVPGGVLAQSGQSVPWQITMQEAVTPVAAEIHWFHDFVNAIIIAIVAFILILLAIVVFRFNERRNPTPSRVTHNTLLEVMWTVVPVIILVVIAIPSFKLLYYADRTVDAEMTLKAIGNQWYWTYEYPDNGEFTFDAIMIEDNELKEGQPRLLTTDQAIVLPVDTDIRLLTTASDVVHAWAMPAFGVKIDAVPGRTNETWFRIEQPGMYYGQCSELCGVRHGFMPIMVKAVSKDAFNAWVEQAKKEFANEDTARARVMARR